MKDVVVIAMAAPLSLWFPLEDGCGVSSGRVDTTILDRHSEAGLFGLGGYSRFPEKGKAPL